MLFESRERLVAALDKRLQGPIGPDLIPWIRDGYAAIARGTSFERYVRDYRCHAIGPLLRDDLAVRPNGVAPDVWEAIDEAGPSGRSYAEGRIASIRRDLEGMADGR